MKLLVFVVVIVIVICRRGSGYDKTCGTRVHIERGFNFVHIQGASLALGSAAIGRNSNDSGY